MIRPKKGQRFAAISGFWTFCSLHVYVLQRGFECFARSINWCTMRFLQLKRESDPNDSAPPHASPSISTLNSHKNKRSKQPWHVAEALSPSFQLGTRQSKCQSCRRFWHTTRLTTNPTSHRIASRNSHQLQGLSGACCHRHCSSSRWPSPTAQVSMQRKARAINFSHVKPSPSPSSVAPSAKHKNYKANRIFCTACS